MRNIAGKNIKLVPVCDHIYCVTNKRVGNGNLVNGRIGNGYLGKYKSGK